MAKEGRDLVQEAVHDAKALREAAIAAAKNQVIESLAPAIRGILEKSIKGVLSQNEDVDRIRRGVQDNWPGESHTGFEEAKEKGKGDPKMDADKKDPQELDLESLASFFPAMAEMPEEDPLAQPVAEDPTAAMPMIPTLGEGDAEDPAACADDEEMLGMKAEAKKDKKEDEPMDEELEISESELKKVYEATFAAEKLAEAQVTKGFGEQTPAGEIDDVVKDVDKGLADVKKGEHAWEKETPPAKQDFTVKEMIQKGLAENKMLRENLKKAVGLVRQLGARLHEVNLFNAKVLHVNQILNRHGRLTAEQKKVVLETIDKAKTISEVKMVYEAITSSFAAAQTLSEKSQKPKANAQRARTSGAPDQKVLGESVDRNSNGDYARLQRLAGIVK